MNNLLFAFFRYGCFVLMWIVLSNSSSCNYIKDPGSYKTIAYITSPVDAELKGFAEFLVMDNRITMFVTMKGLLPNTTYSIHLYDIVDCFSIATAKKDHWNSKKKPHGKHGAGDYHIGDVGNVLTSPNGELRYSFETDDWTINDNTETSVVGKSIGISDKEDDFKSQPSGSSGNVIACGKIQRASMKEFNNPKGEQRYKGRGGPR